MAYIRGMAGVSSRQQGRAFAPRGLSGVSSRIQGRTYAPVAVGADSLGADVEQMSEADWRQQMLAYQRTVANKATEWVEQDRKIRYLQIGATLMIPLAGAFWKWFLGRRRSASTSESLGG